MSFWRPARCLTGRRCDGVARSPSGASAVGRGGPKGWRGSPGLGLLVVSPSAPGRSPALRGRPGRAPAVLRNLSGPLGVSETKGRSTATRTSPAREFLTLAFRVFRAHARAGEGSQGPSGPATRPWEAWCSHSVEQRCSKRTARVRPRAGGGLTKRQTTTTPLRSPFLTPSPLDCRTLSRRATVHR